MIEAPPPSRPREAPISLPEAKLPPQPAPQAIEEGNGHVREEPPAPPPEPEEDASRPRRKGWWQRKLFG
jgi:hypothetical protein